MSVAWVGAGIAAVGAVASYSSSKSAQDQQASEAAAAQQANAYQGQIATSEYQNYQQNFQPLENSMVQQATNYASPEAYEQAASTAQANTDQQIGLQEQRLSRQPGLDPSSAAAQTAQTDLALNGAAMGASAQNTARQNVQNMAWARQMDIMGLGNGLVTNASNGLNANATTAAGLSAQAGRTAATTASNVGGMVTGLGNTFMNAYRNMPNNSSNGYTSVNQYSGGNDGWTNPDGESLGT